MTITPACRCGESWRGGPPLRQLASSYHDATTRPNKYRSLALFVCCLFARRDLLFVVRSLRGAAGALLQGWSLEAPAPKTAHRLASQRCFANCGAFHAAISFAPATSKIFGLLRRRA